MKIKITLQRIAHDNIIEEVFSITPYRKELLTPDRSLMYKVWKEQMNMTMGQKGYKLIDIIYLDKGKSKFIYSKKNKIKQTIPTTDSTIIEYQPIMGTKNCKSCKFSRNNVCMLTGSPANKKSKCGLWMELYVSKENRPGSNGRDNKRILERDKQWRKNNSKIKQVNE